VQCSAVVRRENLQSGIASALSSGEPVSYFAHASCHGCRHAALLGPAPFAILFTITTLVGQQKVAAKEMRRVITRHILPRFI